MVKTFRIMKILKISHLLKNLHVGNSWKFVFKVHENLMKTLYISVLTFFVVHMAACIYVFVG